MAESKWQAHEKRQSDTKATDAVRQKKTSATQSQALLLNALQAGVSPDYLPALMKRSEVALPNSVMLDLLARQDDAMETAFHPLPAGSPETEPMAWSQPTGDAEGKLPVEPGTVDALPPPVALSESAQSV